MSTASLRRDHDLIEKVIKSMETTVLMLRGGAIVPESILMQVMDFATNFTDTCHHSKEENTLFPALAKSGMPTNMGPIGVMLSLALKNQTDRRPILVRHSRFCKRWEKCIFFL